MPPTTSIVSRSTQAVARTTVKSLVESPAYAGRFKQVLGEKAQQFVASLIQVSQTYQLAKADPHSVIAAAMTAAALDLPIDKNLGFAYIVPYGKDEKCVAQYQMGYKGFVQLGMRTGQYKLLNVTEVYEGELIKFDRVKADVVIDSDKRTSDNIVGYVAYMQLINGFEHAEYWSSATVEAHAKRYSQAYRSGYDTPWKTNFDSMAKKTVLKALLSHWGPMSIQMNKALTVDQGVHTDVESEVTYPDNEAPAEPPARETPAEVLGAGKKTKKLEAPKEPAPAKTTLPEAEKETESKPEEDNNRQDDGTGPEAPTNSEELPDLDAPYPSLKTFMERDGVEEAKLVAWCKVNQNEHGVLLANAKPQKYMDIRTDSVLYLLKNWKTLLPSIKA